MATFHTAMMRAPVCRRFAAALYAIALAVILPAGANAQSAAVERHFQIEGRALANPVELSGGVPVLRIKQGQTVEITWTTDEATDLHVHGYDLDLAVDPSTPSSLKFKAAAAGRFAVEAHGFGGRAGAVQQAAAPTDPDQTGLSLDQLADAIIAEIKTAQDEENGVHRADHREVTTATDEDIVLLYIEVLPR